MTSEMHNTFLMGRMAIVILLATVFLKLAHMTASDQAYLLKKGKIAKFRNQTLTQTLQKKRDEAVKSGLLIMVVANFLLLCVAVFDRFYPVLILLPALNAVHFKKYETQGIILPPQIAFYTVFSHTLVGASIYVTCDILLNYTTVSVFTESSNTLLAVYKFGASINDIEKAGVDSKKNKPLP